MTDSELFVNYVGQNYDKLYLSMKRYAINKTGQWDEDIFQETIVRCHDNIERKIYLQDNTPSGIENFFFKSFANNIIREKQYARVAKRVETEDFSGFLHKNDKYDDQLNEKLKMDLKEDFSVLFILSKIEEAFDYQTAHLFSLKYLSGLTYNQIREKTQVKNTRQKILDANKYVIENITPEVINDAFKRFYEEEIER